MTNESDAPCCECASCLLRAARIAALNTELARERDEAQQLRERKAMVSDALRAATERAQALHAALRWADSHVPGQVQCAECGRIAGGHARDCGYAALAAPQGDTL